MYRREIVQNDCSEMTRAAVMDKIPGDGLSLPMSMQKTHARRWSCLDSPRNKQSKEHSPIRQLVDGIVGPPSESPDEHEAATRRHLAGRAAEFFMFREEDDF